MAKQGTIMVVDDNKSILQALELLLPRYFAKVITLSNPNQIDSSLRENAVDVALLDMNYSSKVNNGNEGLYWLSYVKERFPAVQVVMFTAYAEIELAVEAVKRGACDFVVKPWEKEKLVAILTNAYNLKKSSAEVKQLKEIKKELVGNSVMWWGNSPQMLELRKTIEKVAKTDANILITGENGTGKEMLSREIHNRSLRRNELMVTVDMGAVVESLFESELFGHVKGAFTDAKADRAGKFEVANHGTLFLDEIGNIPLHLQAKLLTAIQSGTIVKVGSNTPIPVDIRLISATNRDLNRMVADGEFREDLLYRINTIHLHLPPLRERKEDIPSFANSFLEKYAVKYGRKGLSFSDEAVANMVAYRWPGNIRELEHTIEKAVIMCDGAKILPGDLMLRSSANEMADLSGSGKGKNMPSFETFEEMERAMISAALDKHCGNLSAVASQLGVTRQTLYNKMKKYGL